jgi:hypothetical protein
MTREEKVAVVEAFLNGMVSGDVDALPFAESFFVETPLLGRAERDAAMGYIRATSVATLSIQVESHIVEGDQVATLSENETPNGPMMVFAKFVVYDGLLQSARVFYDPRVILGSSSGKDI